MKNVVIDASVVLKWYLADEEQGAKALELLDSYLKREIGLQAPHLLLYEVLNGLLLAGRKGRLSQEHIQPAFEGFLELGILFKDPVPHYSRMIRFGLERSITAYDAAYLSLAEAQKIPLITADEKLIRLAGKGTVPITSLADFRFGTKT
jgi:predicted nucleic acid-binding protein